MDALQEAAAKLENMQRLLDAATARISEMETDRNEWKSLAELADAKLVALREKLQEAIESF